jgi:hypothetical protein
MGVKFGKEWGVGMGNGGSGEVRGWESADQLGEIEWIWLIFYCLLNICR